MISTVFPEIDEGPSPSAYLFTEACLGNNILIRRAFLPFTLKIVNDVRKTQSDTERFTVIHAASIESPLKGACEVLDKHLPSGVSDQGQGSLALCLWV